MLDLPPQQATIVVTASRAPEAEAETPASVTLIDARRIERIGAPLVTDLLRLVPSLAVSTSGPAGSLTDIRIRGAEANHSLLFVEGIRANDPAAGNIPRFELLNADLASRIEVVRGPQSALWGSEAIGGVVAVDGAAPGSGGSLIDVEAGSFGTRRAAARTTFGTAARGLSLGIAGQRSNGIDSFSGDGERDGYRNLAARIAGTYRLNDSLNFAASGFALRGLSEFDGYNPTTFARDNTEDRSKNRLAAARVAATYGDRATRYATASASLLGSRNRNLVAEDEVNRTRANRRTLGIEAGHRIGRHRFVAAIDGEKEGFHSRDVAYGGFTNQDRDRRHQSFTFEWNMADLGPLTTDVAVRHDAFSKFKDATTVRGSALLALGSGLSVAATYGQGIAQPTFFDLYGFFPGSFTGNPSLRPETSRGGEVGVRYHHGALRGALTYYRQRLQHEIVDVFAFPLSTTVNADGTSRREGIEAEVHYAPTDALRLSATYAYLDASEPRGPGGSLIKEQRRPKHSGSVALDGTRGQLSYGTAIAYTGAHGDTDFDLFPAERVRLSPYWLASARIGYRLVDAVELHLRVANTFDDDYQDVFGYRTEGRSVHAGIASLSVASAALRVASLDLCADEYLLLLARPEEIASVSRVAQDPADSVMWRQARLYPANRQGLESVITTRPNLLLTMGGGGRATGIIAERLRIRTLKLDYPASIGDVEANMVRVATALGDARRADGWRRRLARVRTGALSQRDTIFLSGGGNSMSATSLGARWMALAGFRQRPLAGGRASLEILATRPPAVLLRSTYRRAHPSLGQRWLDHPLARKSTARTIDTDGRPWTCSGPLMISEIERLRAVR